MLLHGALLVAALASVLATPLPSPLESSVKSHSPIQRRDAPGAVAWSEAIQRAKDVVSQMTFDEKINFSDYRVENLVSSGATYANERLNIPSLLFGDGPTGVVSPFTSQFPAQLTVAATWSREHIYQRASAMGKEFHDVGIHTPLSIVVGPMGRNPYGGRNWENFSPDSYLTGEAVRETVKGMQEQGVTGLVKHFFGNEQEYLRIGAVNGGYLGGNETLTLNTIIDDATAHELYVAPFAEAVREGAGAVMCSYQHINGTLACEDKHSLTTILKEELGFKGFVVSDWGAAKNTAKSALAGLDFVEAGGPTGRIWGPNITEAVNAGKLPKDILDEKIVRVLTPYFALNQSSLPDVDYQRSVISQSHNELIRNLSTASITLLKNNKTSSTAGLPFDAPQRVVLVGSGATYGPWGIQSNQASSIFYYTTANDYPGYVANGFGSGGSPSPYLITPMEGIKNRGMKFDPPLLVDGYFCDNATAGTASIGIPGFSTIYLDARLQTANKVVVFVSATAMEGYDRKTLDLENGGDDLIEYVAKRYNDTTVVINAPGPVNMKKWIDNVNVTSVLLSYLPGQEGGNALSDVLFGDVNPSGKLPFTIARNVEDYDLKAYYNGSAVPNPTEKFSEGVFIDYKYADLKNSTPLFEFGYGLSYTTFNFSDIAVDATAKSGRAAVSETNEKLFINNELANGLYDVSHTVTATVKNTGEVGGAEVAQLYLTYPDGTPNKMPIRSLRGFEKPYLNPGESQTVSFELRNKDLAYWSVVKQGWVVPKGEFKVSVGSSSRKLPLKTSFSV